jgi:hypothetical protein
MRHRNGSANFNVIEILIAATLFVLVATLVRPAAEREEVARPASSEKETGSAGPYGIVHPEVMAYIRDAIHGALEEAYGKLKPESIRVDEALTVGLARAARDELDAQLTGWECLEDSGLLWKNGTISAPASHKGETLAEALGDASVERWRNGLYEAVKGVLEPYKSEEQAVHVLHLEMAQAAAQDGTKDQTSGWICVSGVWYNPTIDAWDGRCAPEVK